MSGYDLTNNTSVYTVTTAGQPHPATPPYDSYHVRTEDDILVAIDQMPDSDNFLLRGGSSAVFHVETRETLYVKAVTGSGEVRITALAGSGGANETSVATGGGGGGGEVSGMVVVAGEDTDLAASLSNPLAVYLAGASGGLTINVDEADLAALGAISDAAWSGTGNGTLIAIEKAAYSKLEAIRAAVAGTLTVGLPTGASTAANQATAIGHLSTIATAVGGTLTVGLPSGAATSTLQANGNGYLSTIAESVTGTLSVSLPSGASTSALQTTGNTSLANIETYVNGVSTAANQSTLNTNFGAVGDAAWSGTGDGSLVAIEKASYAKLEAIRAAVAGTLTVGLPSGASTAANQATGNGHLSTIATAVTGVSTAANQAILNTAFGAVSDAAWSGTGDGSLIAIEKGAFDKLELIRAAVAGTLTVGLPTGAATSANQSTANTALTNANTARGTISDAAWSGTGDGSVIAIEKANYGKLEAIRTLLASPLSVTTSGTVNASANFTRPSDTTQYAAGDLIANNTTAGSVTPLSITAARVAAGSGSIRRARLKKSGTSITNASFRVHLYGSSPTPANGDNGAFSTTESSYLGSIDVVMDRVFTDGAKGFGVPGQGADINFKLASGTTVYALLEATSAYTPANAEVFTLELEVFQD